MTRKLLSLSSLRTVAFCLLIVVTQSSLVGCGKEDTAQSGGGGGGGQPVSPPPGPIPPVTVVPPGPIVQPPYCVPDLNGYTPPGCAPITYSTVFRGDLNQDRRDAVSEVLQDFRGILKREWIQGGFATPHECKSGNNFFADVFLARSCTRECKNFSHRAEVNLKLNGHEGVIQFVAGPYRAPDKGICDKNADGAFYIIEVPFWLFRDPSGRGWVGESAKSRALAALFQKRSIHLEVNEDNFANANEVSAQVYYRKKLIGRVQFRRSPY